MIKNILLVGASQMAIEYYKILKHLAENIVVVGRSEESAIRFIEATNHKVIIGGLENYLKDHHDLPAYAIVATGVEQLAANTKTLIKHGIKNILVEKPGATELKDLEEMNELANTHNANIFIGYNRRFYSSVLNAKKMIEEDGGPLSFNFEFTEWAFKIEPLDKKPGVKETWFISNSTHVVDLAFYLGGIPTSIYAMASGHLTWHKKSIFAGSGQTDKGALFSYLANWESPGRWGVEVQTKNRRYIFRPLEELSIQETGSISINKLEIDDTFDKQFKPGLYLQTKSFVDNEFEKLKSLNQQISDFKIYKAILEGNNL